MTNKKTLFAILATALVFGMTVIACNNGTTSSGNDNNGNDKNSSYGGIPGGATTGITSGSSFTGDTDLNGIWFGESTYTIQGITYNNVNGGYEVFKFNNGNWEIGWVEGKAYYPCEKGTYITSGNSLILTRTHIHGYSWGNIEMYDDRYGIKLTAKWYSKAEAIELYKGKNEAEEQRLLDFQPSTETYSVSGDKLTFSYPVQQWEDIVFTKQ